MAKLTTTEYHINLPNLPIEFDGFCIAHIADLHNADFGGQIEKELEYKNPDIIAMTGDIVSFQNRTLNAISLIKRALHIAPIYYVNGNHEARFKNYNAFAKKLRDEGVAVLHNQIKMLQRGDSKVAIVGIDDPAFFAPPKRENYLKQCAMLNAQCSVADIKILLAHRPEYFDHYANCGYDISLTGHAHGGQIRLPRLGAIWAPRHGLLPKTVSGVSQNGNSYMVASRGLGYVPLRMPPRIFNRPELVFATLGC
ncbi:MAG: metallophosphoesterase [Firmicutes bacterium]|nr:metallophosphoesterase [Bacillota bacterium]